MLDHSSTRRERLLALAREEGDRHFDPATNLCLIPRETLWYAIALLFDPAEERKAIGVQLIASARAGDGTHTPATMLALLHAAGDALTQPGRDNLLHSVGADLSRAAAVVWRDGNVNHPLGAYATLLLGGEVLGQPWAAELGRNRLEELQRTTGDRRHRIHRQSEMSEYMSLTYTALDLVFLALIGAYARDPAARALGLWLEQRLWVNVALHFHAPSEQFAGPHSRSYQEDSTGGWSALHGVVYAACDRPLFIEPGLSVRYQHPSTMLQGALTAITPFHVPPEADLLMWEKPLPLLMQKMTYGEQYHENLSRPGVPFDDETYPGGWSELTTYMTEEYALGTAARPYVNAGHADSVMLRIRRAPRIESVKDFRSLYTRGVFNGAVVGQANRSHVTGGMIDASYLYEESRCAVYQHRDRAIVLVAPKRSGHAGVEEFRLDILAGWEEPFDAMTLGGMAVRSLPALGGPNDRFCFQDYKTYGVIIPLALSPAAGPAPIRLWTSGGHLMLSLMNYSGPPTTFGREQLSAWRNGFVLHLATTQDFGSFKEFVAWTDSLTVTETVMPTLTRQVHYQAPDGLLSVQYDPFRELFLMREFNGEPFVLEHMRVEGGPQGKSLLTPPTLFGSEGRPA